MSPGVPVYLFFITHLESGAGEMLTSLRKYFLASCHLLRAAFVQVSTHQLVYSTFMPGTIEV